MKVLVVDDDPISLNLLARLVRDSGFEVELANDGLTALSIIRRGQTRIVISDLDLPGMDGMQLCRAVRDGTTGRYTYFFLLTAHDTPQVCVEGLAAGADDYIAKPFDPGQLAMRLRTARRIVSLETIDMTIFVLAKLAEMRDTETARHVERVSLYARTLSRVLLGKPGLSQRVDAEFLSLIYQTSALHDIGKVAIPDLILRKPSGLTPAEFELMKTHTTIGAQTLEAAVREYPDAPFLKMAHDICLTHHEHFDGGGYPHGLKGDEIPLAGRIVALADVYDAMTSARPYKAASPHEVVKQMIVSGSGKQFDPVVVGAFLQAENEFISVLTRFGDVVGYEVAA